MKRGRNSIAELAAKFGVSYRTLRFYEELGLLQPERCGREQRSYTEDDRKRMVLILEGKRLGFRLSEIERLIIPHDEVVGTDAAAKLDRATIARQIGKLTGERDNIVAAIDELKNALSSDRFSEERASDAADRSLVCVSPV